MLRESAPETMMIKTLLFCLSVLILTPEAFAQTATVTWTMTHQTIDGWGGQTWGFGDNLTAAQSDCFFSVSDSTCPTTSIGLAYVRTQTTWDNGVPDLNTLRNAVARGAKVWAEVYPPCSLKYTFVELGQNCAQSGDGFTQPPAYINGTESSNGTCFVDTQPLSTTYAAFATYIESYLATMANYGTPVSVLSLTNEPNLGPSSLGNCLMKSGALISQMITSVIPAINAAGYHPQVLMPQAWNWFNTDLASDCLNNTSYPGCSSLVSIVAGHAYGYPYRPTPYALGTANGHHLWVSETGEQSSAPDTSMSNGLTWAKNIHDWLTIANVSSVDWWALGFSGTYGLTDENFTFPAPMRFYAEGNWSKYVRPGWVRIDATANPVNQVYITAFKDTSGDFAIVAVNENATPVNLEFSLAAFPSVTSVTPTVTSDGANLEDQASIRISSNAFSHSLVGTSVTTFHGTAASSASKGPASPTNLAASVN